MSDIATLPTRAEFIRDRLAEHLDGLGWILEETAPEDVTPEGYATLYAGNAAQDFELYVDTFGVVRDGEDDTICGFAYSWRTVPTDTGVMHGPWRLREAVAAGDEAATRWALRWNLDVRAMRAMRRTV